MPTRPIIFKDFAGLDNKHNSIELSAKYLTQADNIDITDGGLIKKRRGFTLLTSGAFRNLWSNNVICLATLNSDLVQVNSDYTTTILRAGVGTFQMSYADVNGVIFYTNSKIIGYISNAASFNLPDPVGINKTKLPAGNLIEFYRGRLYVASGKTVWISDAVRICQLDIYKGFKQINEDIIMMKAVVDGLWIGTSNRIYFIQGTTPDNMLLVEKADYGIFGGASDITLNGITVLDFKLKLAVNVKSVIFMSKKGLCVGTSGGQFINLTERNFIVPSAKKVIGLIRTDGDINQYLSIFSN